MAAARVVVAPDLLHVHRHQAHRVRAVQHNGNSSAVDELGHLRGRQQEAAPRRHVADRHDPCPRPDQAVKVFEQGVQIVAEAHLSDDNASTPCQVHPGQGTSRMLLVAYDHLVAGPPVHAGGDDIDALGHVPRQRHLGRVRAQQPGHAAFRVVISLPQLRLHVRVEGPVHLGKPGKANDLVHNRSRLGTVAHVQVARPGERRDPCSDGLYVYHQGSPYSEIASRSAGSLASGILGACPRIRSGRRNPPHSNLITAPQTFLWSYSYMVTPLETHIV